MSVPVRSKVAADIDGSSPVPERTIFEFEMRGGDVVPNADAVHVVARADEGEVVEANVPLQKAAGDANMCGHGAGEFQDGAPGECFVGSGIDPVQTLTGVHAFEEKRAELRGILSG